MPFFVLRTKAEGFLISAVIRQFIPPKGGGEGRQQVIAGNTLYWVETNVRELLG